MPGPRLHPRKVGELMAALALAPITKTAFARRITRGGRGLTEHRECWAAETTDGVWKFDREDSPGTPWLVYHRQSAADGSLPVPVTLCGTLRACRVAVAEGWAADELAKRKAEHAERMAAL